MRKVIDLHCDTLTELDKRALGLDCEKQLHFSMGRIPEEVRWCQCMAVFMPDNLRGGAAEEYFSRLYKIYERETRLNKNRVAAVTEMEEISEILDKNPIATILTIEGGSALAGKIENVEKLYNLGVRMMTLTWNAANEIAGGANTDAGFTEFGREAVGEMERVGMAVDVSHLSDRGFGELCTFATKPFAASHSNSRTICGHKRNLTDEMFGEIVRRGGIVGLNYYDIFIKNGGGSEKIEDLLEHINHFLKLGGEDTIALGSDFDGADMPPYLEGAEKITGLITALEESGVEEKIIDKLLFRNAARFLGGLKKSEVIR